MDYAVTMDMFQGLQQLSCHLYDFFLLKKAKLLFGGEERVFCELKHQVYVSLTRVDVVQFNDVCMLQKAQYFDLSN